MDAGTFEGFSTAIEEPGILTVTFNRPETMNASTIPMKRDLVELITQVQMDDTVRVFVFTGAGRAFWAGDDMKSYGGDRRGHAGRSAPATTHRSVPTTRCGPSARRSTSPSATSTS